MQQTDILIIGGGIIGLAVAYRLGQRYPLKRVIVLEKESRVGQHQTGHNSGVLHSGIYYRPGSLKATNCRAGKAAMEALCRQEDVPYDLCGKVIVAVDASEIPALEQLQTRAQANGVRCERIGPERLRELEPHAAGVQALHVPETGIVDFGRVCTTLANLVRDAGGEFVFHARVTALRRERTSVVVETTAGDFEADYVVNCAGLYSDRVARLGGAARDVSIIPFRGEFYRLRPDARHLCRNLIYPVPDPRLPFLGAHFTRTIRGDVECGPNAVLAFAREGYALSDFSARDTVDALFCPGFLRLAWRYWRAGARELWQSVSTEAFVRVLRRLVPEITAGHVQRASSGVRAQALDPSGDLVDDFRMMETERAIHVCNAPSPAATSALNIGALVVDRLAVQLR